MYKKKSRIDNEYINNTNSEQIFNNFLKDQVEDSKILIEKSLTNSEIEKELVRLNWEMPAKDLLLNNVLKSFKLFSKPNDKSEQFKNLNYEDFLTLYDDIQQLSPRWIIDTSNNCFKILFDERKKRQFTLKHKGAYYTPKIFSDFMARTSIEQIQEEKLEKVRFILGSNLPQTQVQSILKNLIPIRIIDIALGTGIFLRSTIPYLTTYIREVQRLIQQFNSKSKTSLKRTDEHVDPQLILDLILNECLYGVDIDPRALEMAKLSVIHATFQHLNLIIDESQITDWERFLENPHFRCSNSIISGFSKDFLELESKTSAILWDKSFPDVFSNKILENYEIEKEGGVKNGIERDGIEKEGKQFSRGFDIVIGNPPWEILKPNEREFFRVFYPEFQTKTRKEQDEIKDQLLSSNPLINQYFTQYQERIYAQMKFIENSNLYSHQSAIIDGKREMGDPQLYKLLMETAFKIVREGGIISYLTQHNFAGSKGCAGLRKLYLTSGQFLGIWEFYNKTQEHVFFPNVDLKQRFIILSYQKKPFTPENGINYKFCSTIDDLKADFQDFNQIPIGLIKRFSKDEYQIFGFRSAANKSIFIKLLNNPSLSQPIEVNGKKYECKFFQDLHVTRDRYSMTEERINLADKVPIPVWSGKNVGIYLLMGESTRYYQLKTLKKGVLEVNKRLIEEFGQAVAERSIVCRNILPNSAKRLIFSRIPEFDLIDNSCTRIILNPINKIQIMETDDKDIGNTVIEEENIRGRKKEEIDDLAIDFLLSVCNSLICEYYLKTFLTGINLNYYILSKIPIPKIDTDSIRRISENVVYLISHDAVDPTWAEKYIENEVILAKSYGFTIIEFKEIINSFEFDKLQKTELAGIRPFIYITQTELIKKFETI